MNLRQELLKRGKFPKKKQGRGKRPRTSRGMRILDMRQCRPDVRRRKLLAIMSTSWKIAWHGRKVPGALRGKQREKLDEAQEWMARVDALVEKGTRDSVARFQHGRAGALERPFPLIKVEEELKTIMDCLAGAFAAVDIGIGRIEETEGMVCKEGHYRDLAGALWEGGAGDQAWLSVLWPMRSMEKNIISAQSALYETACRVDGMRPKAHSIIKMYPLAQGFQWELEKKRERAVVPASGHGLYKADSIWGWEGMEGQTDTLCVAENVIQLKTEDGSGQKKGHGKPSLRKRLEMAGEKSHQMNDRGSLQERKSKIGERQR